MDVYAIVTEKIINLLEQGVVPWRRPWTGSGLPRNVISKKPYRGINHFLLSASKYVQPYWLTMRQARTNLVDTFAKARRARLSFSGRSTTDAARRKTRATPNQMSNAAGALSSDTIASGTSSNASCRNARSKTYRESKLTSTIRLKR
jgi:antirestriction protein ArdC